MFRSLSRGVAALSLTLCAAAALAQSPAVPVQVEDAWARLTVQGQTGSGVFMRLTAREAMSLVGASSPAAGQVEVHEMKLEGDVMRMRAVPVLALPAGQAVTLRPGGYHLMLTDLKTPLRRGTQLPLTLVFKDAKGAERKLELQVPVRALAPSSGAAAPVEQHKH
jgi:copper(I)-binding protein